MDRFNLALKVSEKVHHIIMALFCLLRWIKFEEDLEEDADRWSKPHVATLSPRSLFELCICVHQESVQLDLDAENLCQIVHEVLLSI